MILDVLVKQLVAPGRFKIIDRSSAPGRIFLSANLDDFPLKIIKTSIYFQDFRSFIVSYDFPMILP
jgi:hypothetical protein